MGQDLIREGKLDRQAAAEALRQFLEEIVRVSGLDLKVKVQAVDAPATDGSSEAEVIAHCRRHFAYQKCPKVVVFGDEVPVTSTGKYQRNKLKPLFTEWKSVQFTERGGARSK